MEKLIKLQEIMKSDYEQKSNLEQAIQKLDEKIDEKLKQIADDQANDLLLDEYKQLVDDKGKQEIKFKAFNSKQLDLKNLAEEVKEEFKNAKKEYHSKVGESIERVKDFKRKYNDDVIAEKENRLKLSDDLNKYKNQVVKAIDGIIEVNNIRIHNQAFIRDIKPFGYSDIKL